jgi:hypothetical protein
MSVFELVISVFELVMSVFELEMSVFRGLSLANRSAANPVARYILFITTEKSVLAMLIG